MAKNERKADFLVPVSENLYCVIKRMQMGALLALWLLEKPPAGCKRGTVVNAERPTLVLLRPKID